MSETPKETVLVLRTCDKHLQSRGGFQWPGVGGTAEAPDWQPTQECGHGLHGLLNGEGDWGLLDWSLEAKAMIVETEKSGVVEIGGKVKFRTGIVRKIGILASLLCELGADKLSINRQVKDIADAASGDASQLAASGYASQLAASGDASQLAASGDASQLAASGNYSKLAASGYASKLAASGDASQLAASGYASQLAASGDASQLAASGYASKLAASGDASQLAASGNASVVMCAGYSAKAKAGHNGVIALAWHDGTRPRVAVGYVGEQIKADTWYKIEGGEWKEVQE